MFLCIFFIYIKSFNSFDQLHLLYFINMKLIKCHIDIIWQMCQPNNLLNKPLTNIVYIFICWYFLSFIKDNKLYLNYHIHTKHYTHRLTLNEVIHNKPSLLPPLVWPLCVFWPDPIYCQRLPWVCPVNENGNINMWSEKNRKAKNVQQNAHTNIEGHTYIYNKCLRQNMKC